MTYKPNKPFPAQLLLASVLSQQQRPDEDRRLTDRVRANLFYTLYQLEYNNLLLVSSSHHSAAWSPFLSPDRHGGTGEETPGFGSFCGFL